MPSLGSYELQPRIPQMSNQKHVEVSPNVRMSAKSRERDMWVCRGFPQCTEVGKQNHFRCPPMLTRYGPHHTATSHHKIRMSGSSQLVYLIIRCSPLYEYTQLALIVITFFGSALLLERARARVREEQRHPRCPVQDGRGRGDRRAHLRIGVLWLPRRARI